MTTTTSFAAQLIRTSSRGLSGMITADLFQRVEAADGDDASAPYGADGFQRWSQAVADRLATLATALDDGDPDRFGDDMRWFRSMSDVRGIPIEHLHAFSESLGHVLRSRLPEGTAESLEPYLTTGRAALDQGGETKSELHPGSPAAELFELALVGDTAGARAYVIDLVQTGQRTAAQVIEGVILIAMREAGRRWHFGEMGVATEHVVTACLRSSIHALPFAGPPAPPNGKAIFIASVSGDAHDTALLALSVLFELEGWRVALAGCDTPTDEVDETAAAYGCDVIALSATLPGHRHGLSTYLASRTSEIPVILGGAAVRDAADAASIGGKSYAATVTEAIAVARDIVRL